MSVNLFAIVRLPGNKLVSVFGYNELHLPLGGIRAIFSTDGPAVWIFHIQFGAACVDHRLNGEAHARCKNRAFTRFAHEEDEGVFVEIVSNAVTSEFAHYAKAVFFGICLHGVGDVAYGCPGFYCS